MKKPRTGITSDRTAIIAEIEAAFRDTARPSRSNIVSDSSGKHLECNQIQKRFENRDWSDIVDNPNKHESSDLSFMTPLAMKYYLPGYMIACVEKSRTAVKMTLSLERRLTPPEYIRASGSQYFEELVKILTRDQYKAISNFLRFLVKWHPEYYSDDDKIYSAISYWDALTRR